jgi:hypothetical protein
VSFLAPFWLGLVAAAAVPIVLHLLRRRSGARVEFPAVRFLIKAQQENQRELRLRNLLLMLVRVVAVVAIAMAAARPVGSVGGTGHAPTALAIVVDNSLSTSLVRDGAPTLATLTANARDVLARATEQDRVWLLTVDGTVLTGLASVQDGLARLTPIAGQGDLPAAVERAVAAVNGSGLAASHVVVLTDGQAVAFPSAPVAGATPVTVLSSAASDVPNRAVLNLRTEPARWSPRGALSIALRSPDSTDVRVVLGERTVARSVVGPDASLTVRAQAPASSWLAGRVELPADELRGDDVRHFAVLAGAPPGYTVATSAGGFAEGAIATLVDGARATRGGGILVTGAETLRSGAALIAAPLDAVQAGAANRALAAANIPWRLGAVVRDEATVRDGALNGVSVRARHRLDLTTADSGTVLARVAGEPWIVAGDGYVLIGSPLDPAATTLPVDARFVPWIEQVTLAHLLSGGGPILEVAPLAAVTVPVAVDELVSADSTRRALTGRTLDAPTQTGVHWLRRGGRIVGALVVNAEAAESDLTPLSGDAMRARIDGANVIVAADAATAAGRAFDSAARRPLITIMLIVLLLALLAEAWIAREPQRVQT